MKKITYRAEECSLKNWREAFEILASSEKAAILSRFFKTGKGEYGEGDLFLGIPVPEVRAVSRRFAAAEFSDVQKMLMSPYHEHRLSALLVLVEKFARNRRSPTARKEVVDFYLVNATRANNWDLVDLSAPKILGEWMIENPSPALLDKLSESNSLWEQRIAIVSTLTLIRAMRFADTLRLAKRFLSHSHPLMHKATGWMLREVGKRDMTTLREFLDEHAARMPRTALRYAIEKMDAEERKAYMAIPRAKEGVKRM